MDILTKIKTIMFEPTKFFTKSQKEIGIKGAFKYLTILALFSSLLTFIVSYFFQPFQTSFIERLIGSDVLSEVATPTLLDALSSYAAILILSFLIVGILHLWIKLFKGKAKYKKTYQLYVYGTTPSFLLSWIPFVGNFAWIYSLIVLITGTSIIHKISKTRSMILYLIPVILLIILMVIATIILLTSIAANGGI
jgi:hypothetical protein